VPLIRTLARGRPVDLLDIGSLETAAAAARAAAADAGEEPPQVEAVRARAEDLEVAARSGARAWDVVTARAVAPLGRLVELAMPLLARHGRLVAWKRDDGSGAFEDELDDAESALRGHDATVRSVVPVPLEGLTDHRLVVVVRRGMVGRSRRSAGGGATAPRRAALLP
jgi:16S rRNA (guanine527-N7)-methyltransferase